MTGGEGGDRYREDVRDIVGTGRGRVQERYSRTGRRGGEGRERGREREKEKR